MEPMLLFIILYSITKFICYVGWCYVALIYLGYPSKRKKTVATILGSLRLTIGVLIGTLAIFGFVRDVHAIVADKYLAYFIAYPTVRIFEWGFIWLVLSIIYRNQEKAVGKHTPMRIILWIIGGIIISCLADIPILLSSNGIPIGRIFC